MHVSTGYWVEQCGMVGSSQVPPKISASLSSQGEAQQPTEEGGEDEDDHIYQHICGSPQKALTV